MKSAGYRHVIILTLLVASVFGNTLGHGFVWDDTLFVPDGEVYRSFDISAIFLTLKANGLEYLPIRDLSYAFDCNLWKDNPAGYHLSNLLYFWLTILVLYFFAVRLVELSSQKDSPVNRDDVHNIAFVSAALFAVHPIHSEAVSFITCRNVLLSGLFFFISCYAWLEYLTGRGKQRVMMYAAALFFFLLSIFSKATGIILPLILLVETWIISRSFARRQMTVLAPFFILSAGAFLLFTEIARKTDVFLRDQYSTAVSDKIILAVQIPSFYLVKLVLPFDFSADYGTEQFNTTLATPGGICSLLLLIMLTLTIWLCRNKAALVSFAISWFLISLIPVLHLFPTIPVVADRYVYLPSFGFCFVFAVTGTRFLGRRFLFGAAPLLMLLAILTCRQNLVWKNEKILWENTLAVSPRSATALAELGRIYFWEERNVPIAMEMYRRSSEVNAGDPAFDIFQGHLLMMKKDFPNAIIAFRRAVDKDPENIEAVINLGRAYQSTGAVENAAEQYRRAISLPELDPRKNMRGRAADYLEYLNRR